MFFLVAEFDIYVFIKLVLCAQSSTLSEMSHIHDIFFYYAVSTIVYNIPHICQSSDTE
jgi:hypothetical protein